MLINFVWLSPEAFAITTEIGQLRLDHHVCSLALEIPLASPCLDGDPCPRFWGAGEWRGLRTRRVQDIFVNYSQIFIIAESQPRILAAWDESMKPSQDGAVCFPSSFFQYSNMTSHSRASRILFHLSVLWFFHYRKKEKGRISPSL